MIDGARPAITVKFPAGKLGFVGVATPTEVKRWPGLPPSEIVGRSGVEESYDAVVRGIDGQQCVYVDLAGVPVAQGPRRDPIPGANLRLSIDLPLQQQLTARLAAALAAKPPGGLGAAVAMDPRTGAVLAMASLPSYDNNVYGPPVDAAALRQAENAGGRPMLQHATQMVAPPGSTFKLVVASADMAHPVFAPDQVIPTGGSFTLGDHTFNNWRVLPPQSLVQAIAWSNDVVRTCGHIHGNKLRIAGTVLKYLGAKSFRHRGPRDRLHVHIVERWNVVVGARCSN